MKTPWLVVDPVKADAVAQKARDDAILRNALAGPEPIVVLVLGGQSRPDREHASGGPELRIYPVDDKEGGGIDRPGLSTCVTYSTGIWVLSSGCVAKPCWGIRTEILESSR